MQTRRSTRRSVLQQILLLRFAMELFKNHNVVLTVIVQQMRVTAHYNKPLLNMVKSSCHTACSRKSWPRKLSIKLYGATSNKLLALRIYLLLHYLLPIFTKEQDKFH